MKKERGKDEKDSYEEKSLLEKIAIPVIIILALGLAFLLTIKKKLVSLLTGLSVFNSISNSTINTLILVCIVGIAIFIFYKIKKR